MFENVNYTYYSETLGRSAVPDPEAFNKFVLENEMYMKRLISDGLVEEREENGIDSAVCMMVEVDYLASQTANGESAPEGSESIGSYSHSVNTKAYEKYIEQNAKSIEQQKYRWIGLFCNIHNGVR